MLALANWPTEGSIEPSSVSDPCDMNRYELESGSETIRAILGDSLDAVVIEGRLDCLETIQYSEELVFDSERKA